MTHGLWASGLLLACLVLGTGPAMADGAPTPGATDPPPPVWAASLLLACDSCGCSVLPYTEKTTERGWQFGIGEQFTNFDRLQTEGVRVSDPFNQWETSYITQFLIGYNFNDRNGLTLTIPYIDRSFHRVLGPFADGSSQVQDGNVSGLGDVTLQDRYVLARHTSMDYTMVTSVSAGLKLPTGSPDELRSEVSALLGGPDSVVGGHDLALGSGSLDLAFGGQWSYHRKAFISDAVVQYSARNPGAFGYRYGNEFQWDVAGGWYLHSEAHSGRFVAAQLVLDGENKNEDVFGGNQIVVDTGASETYIGPRLSAATGPGQFATLELDIPVHEQNSDTQLMPGYKVRAAFVLRR